MDNVQWTMYNEKWFVTSIYLILLARHISVLQSSIIHYPMYIVHCPLSIIHCPLSIVYYVH